ncbi:rhomboid family intramembrane serine protease [Mucilaginibacter gotjawali]|uniref:Membrane associated rhomboid family serine protease n=2 Tax=Mucilaginibacter gotjawali TaxID=1550579 RepID=A0A839S8U1_9SPHI|nr:rhomboid family intramembrane serine protease [Mucilaginibacter gotjawali]MBB3054226.1 membrane associated rhomboid family serine protease [Mucilaginibacter gotjawali]BAU51941.1 intramembrane serine protease GlpG [Mucilaginibacter gotjawali]
MIGLIHLSESEAPVTYCLMLIIALVSLAAIYNKGIFAALLLHPYSVIRQRQYYRLFTTDLVHNDLVHLVFNEVSLYIFGANLEVTLEKRMRNGGWHMLQIFVISELAGNVFYTVIHRNRFDYSSAGCSGSVMGCLFAFMILDPYGTALSFAFIGGIRNIFTGLIYIVLLSYYRWKKGNEMVNHEIHLYGALGGILAVLIVCPAILF